MSFFHRPGNSSSEESSEEDDELEISIDESTQQSGRDSTGTAEEVVIPDTTTESLSLTNTIGHGEDGRPTIVEDAKDMMLATMLEELTKYRAADMMNNAVAGNGQLYDKNSPEVQEFAKGLFNRTSGALNTHGWLSNDASSDTKKGLRQQYMAGLEQLGFRSMDGSRRNSVERGRLGSASPPCNALIRRPSQQPAPFVGGPKSQLQQLDWELAKMDIVRRPSAELQLARPLHLRSHYSSTFEEKGLLGRGGFGRVYRTTNVLDQKEYAIKKIPLSPRLSEKYQSGGHQELTHILREVQALAKLDHYNVVRYHGTWIEEPALPPPPQSPPIQPMLSYRGRMLLDNKPAPQNSPSRKGRIISATSDEDDLFERNGNKDDPSHQLWSVQPSHQSISLVENAPLFTDGRSHHHDQHHGTTSTSSTLDDPTVYVLHVQMSMYPLTLSDYLQPASSPRRNSLAQIPLRHCFHLLPTLRLLLSILCGLQYIHCRGYVHRDLKPSNIFLSTLEYANPLTFSPDQGYADVGSCPGCFQSTPRFMNPRIGDFGLVAELERAADAGPSSSDAGNSVRSGKAVGTEYYRPPQQRSTVETIDEKIDVFALGVIFVELLWICGTRMERIGLLRGCQDGQVPDGLRESLAAEGFSAEVVEMVNECVRGMICPNPRERWRCAMVKSAVEEVLVRISDERSVMKVEPD